MACGYWVLTSPLGIVLYCIALYWELTPPLVYQVNPSLTRAQFCLPGPSTDANQSNCDLYIPACKDKGNINVSASEEKTEQTHPEDGNQRMTETAVSAISRCVFLDIPLCAPRQLLFSLTAAFAGSDVLPPQAACQHNPSCHLGGTSFKGEQRSKQLCQPLKRIKTPVSSDADRGGLCGSPSQIKRSHHQISFFSDI